MGLYGVLVVTDNGSAYGTAFDKDVALLLSEIDPVQNDAVNTAVTTAGFTDTAAWNGQTGQCGDPTIHSCYPPAVNYTPQYYLINGVAFDRSNIAAATQSILAPVSPATTVASSTGKVLVRFVNAGLRFHVPSIVGAPMTLLAEDGNKLPGNGARVQNSVLLTAGKTYDVAIQPAVAGGNYTAATYAVFDRELSLSTANQRDGGMQSYLSVAGGATSGAGSATSGTTLTANTASGAYTYYCSAGVTLSISDPSKGLLAGATGASGVALGTTFTGDVSAANLALQSNGTFT
jgi:FtsP/CotA-like multicopper oxidase with cupredoxin domain